MSHDIWKEARNAETARAAFAREVISLQADLTTRTQERDEARAAFVECYRAVPTSSCDQACDCRHCTARTEYAALYVACTKGGEPDASSQ